MGEPGPFRGLMYIVLKRLWVGLRLRQRAPHQLQPPTLSSHRAWCSHNNNLRDSAETAENKPAAAAPQAAAAAPPPLEQQRRGGATEETKNPEEAEEKDGTNVKFLILVTLFFSHTYSP